MPRTNSKYVEAALAALLELGGGPVPSRVLVDAIIDKGLLPNRKYLYHNVLQKIRASEMFDTSKRGFVALAQLPINEAPEEPEEADLVVPAAAAQ